MKSILITCLLLGLCSIHVKGQPAEKGLPLFGVVKEKAATVFTSPEHPSKKQEKIPPHALLGIDGMKVIQGEPWYRVYQLVQMTYENMPKNNRAWIRASSITPKNRGYVIINKQPSCAYAIGVKSKTNNTLYEVVKYLALNKDSEVIGIQSTPIPRNHLRGESRFGVSYNDGYCTTGCKIEDYLTKLATQTRQPIKAGSRVGSENCSLIWPKNTNIYIESNGGVRVEQSIPLKHLSGSDERDDPELLYERNLFNATFYSSDSLKKALKIAFPDAKNERLINNFHYNPKTGWFTGTKKGDWVEPLDFFGKKAQRITLGCEGVGVVYTFYKQDDKVVMVKRGFDHNPPLNPKTHQAIKGNWSFPNETKMMKTLIQSLKVQ